MKTIIRLLFPTIMLVLSSFLINCTKQEDATKEPTVPIINSIEVTEINQNKALSGG